jgi:hypothetical protein
MTVQTAFSTLMLGAAIWVGTFLLPRARREHDIFGVVCCLMALVVAVIGWLFLSVAVHSR